MQALLELGADPNLGDDFSNIYQVAKEKRMNSLHGRNLYSFDVMDLFAWWKNVQIWTQPSDSRFLVNDFVLPISIDFAAY